MTGSRAATSGYRADIDGLRAVAVISVVLYHINSGWVPGGYVGVDIFFVISGFLITRNIRAELRAGRFSLREFYLRRIRRIAPAFLVVTAATLAVGSLLLLPVDLLRLARSAAWAAMSAANIYYWKFLDTGYFAAETAEEPLLHLWSLGVEEQFYLVWPLMLMALAMAGRRRTAIAAMLAICAGSFAMAEITNVSAQKFAYYMLPTRAGEFMLGALLAFFVASDGGSTVDGRRAWHGWGGEIAAVFGSGLIAWSLWGLDDASPFPGVNAVYPCLGAVSLMLAGHYGSRLVRILLATRAMVCVGLISYSLYLWHWPILAFIRYFHGEVSLSHAALAGVLMLLLAAVSYRFVEQPARHMRSRPLKQVMALFVGPVAVIWLGSMLLIRSDGMKSAIESAPGLEATFAVLDEQTRASGRSVFPCMDSRSRLPKALQDPRCVLGSGAKPSVFLWGDSNAAHYAGALRAVAEEGGFAFRYSALSTCPALFGEGEFGASYSRDRCTAFREGVRKYLRRSDAKVVVLASQWVVHGRNSAFKTALRRTIRDLRKTGKRVVVLGQVPGFPGYTRDCEKRWVRVGDGNCEERLARPQRQSHSINRYLAKLAEDDQLLTYLDIDEVLCDGVECSPYVGGAPAYFNPSHLSADGSYRIGRAIVRSGKRNEWLQAFGPVDARSRSDGLVGGYQPGFPYRVRSQRHHPVGRGQHQHVVIAEFLRSDWEVVARDVSVSLARQGFRVRGPIQRNSVKRYVALRGPLTVTVDISPQPSIPLVSEAARGIVSFAWRDGRPQ